MKFRLGDICTITKGETGIMKAIPGAYTMVALGEANKTHNEFQFDTKAVIIPLVSSTGHGHASMKRVKYQEGKFALGNILCAVIPKDENFVLAKYLHIYLHWNREELLVSQMKGMANVSLSISKIAEVIVTVPNLEKQRQIVELEQKLVAKELIVEKLFIDQLTQLENLNQAILQEAVQGKLVPQNQADEPASELLKRIKTEKTKSGKKENPLPPIKPEEIPFEIPESWVWCRLGKIALHSEAGKSFKCEEVPIKSNEWGVIKVSAVSWDNFSEDQNKLYSLNQPTDLSAQIKIGDFIISRANTSELVGKSVVVKKLTKNLLLSDKTIRFRFSDFVFVEYVNLCNNSKHARKFYAMSGTGSSPSMKNITRDHMKELLIPLPPLSEQTRIAAEIDKQLAKTKQIKEHIIANQHATEQLLKALLHGAFLPRLAGEMEEKENIEFR